jgi:hypothetical protein
MITIFGFPFPVVRDGRCVALSPDYFKEKNGQEMDYCNYSNCINARRDMCTPISVLNRVLDFNLPR